MKKFALLALQLFSLLKPGLAQQGKDGAKIISSNNVVVNEYTTLLTDASAGDNSITVVANTLNTNGRFPGVLSAGDLVMIIQMQGATINGTPNDSTWGAISSYNNCGWYEEEQVLSIAGSTIINLTCPLKNNYTQTGKVQVIRIPRYSSLTVNASDTLICDSWDGAKGGVLVVEVSGNTIVNGAINATAKGFRGGALNNVSGAPRIFDYVSTDVTEGGEKGESIAGYESDYTIYGGEYDRGAPANGGGGGDAWNAAGGGGANAGDITKWNGFGNPDITTSASYIQAWNLEYNGFANNTSSGGGRGGYAVAQEVQNPLLIGPDTIIWDFSFYRDNVGGLGGRPLDYSTGRLFLGGGGGAGHEDNGNGGGGGNGGGLVYFVSYGTISGNGTFLSNGQKGYDDNSLGGKDGDGIGGAGGGGTIILNSAGSITGINIYANGGNGGNQYIDNPEAEGPGGGGGGGYIGISNGAITTKVSGGANGTTDCSLMTLFPPDGTTSGGAGIAAITAFCPMQLGAITGSLTICSGLPYTYSVPAASCGNPTYAWTLPSGWSGSSTTNTITVTAGTSGGTISVSSCPLDTSIVVTVYPAAVYPNFPKDTLICGTVDLPLSAGSTSFHYLWSTGDTTISIVATDTGTYWLRVSGSCDTVSDTTTILQEDNPKVFLGNDTSYCSNFTRVLNGGDSMVTYKWSTGATTQTITVSAYGTYWVTVSNNCGQATDTIKLTSCEGGYVVPNAFTPGTDNANNLIGLLKTGYGSTTLQYFRIYNRWGQLIFSTNDDQAKWDGRFNGTQEPIGVFVYVVNYDDSFGVNKQLKGNITLLR